MPYPPPAAYPPGPAPAPATAHLRPLNSQSVCQLDKVGGEEDDVGDQDDRNVAGDLEEERDDLTARPSPLLTESATLHWR